MQVLGRGAAEFQEVGERADRLRDLGVAGRVTVVGDDDLAAVECDVIPVGQRGLAARGVGATEVPHAGQCDDAQLVLGAAVCFLRAFGDPQRHSGVAERVSDVRSGWNVDAVALPVGRLILDRLAVADPRIVGPVLVPPRRSADIEQRDE